MPKAGATGVKPANGTGWRFGGEDDNNVNGADIGRRAAYRRDMTDKERLLEAIETMTDAEAGTALRTLAGASGDLVAWIQAHAAIGEPDRSRSLS